MLFLWKVSTSVEDIANVFFGELKNVNILENVMEVTVDDAAANTIFMEHFSNFNRRNIAT